MGPKAPGSKADNSFLNKKGVDTVLEITVPDFGLSAASDINPPLAFFVNLQARLIRTTDGFVLYEQKYKYTSGLLLFTEWAADEAKRLREEFDCCYRDLAEKVVQEVFLRHNSPLNPAPHS